MTNEDIKKIGEEFERFLNPVYEQLDRIEQTQKGQTKTLEEHSKKLDKHSQVLEENTDKVDALMSEMHDVHQELEICKEKTDTDIEKIKNHINLPTSTPS